MASSVLKLFSTFLVLLCIFHQGLADSCSTSNIVFTQVKTGNVVEGKPEYEVMVANYCDCPQSQVIAQCYGLNSVEPVDPSAIKPVDDTNCIVKGGGSLVPGSPVKFKYAWTTPQDFPVVSSQINC